MFGRNKQQKNAAFLKEDQGILFLWLSSCLFVFLSGCGTTLFSTDNRFLLCLPGAERRSDYIEGILRPWERKTLIEEKGTRGYRANLEEKVILTEHLVQEFNKTLDPNIRQSCVEALGKIATNAHIEPCLLLLNEAFYDENLNVRISACDALGAYCTEGKGSQNNQKIRQSIAEKLCLRYGELPYSINPGEKKENDERKDLRLAIIRNLSKFKVEESSEILTTLNEALNGEKLDDGALQIAAMISLESITNHKYGLNSEKWNEYLAFSRGESSQKPEEISLLERIPKPDLPMFK